MSNTQLVPTPWEPDPILIPVEWMDLIDVLERRTVGMQHEYVLGVRLDARGVGELLRSWGLPLSIVLAGFLQEYDRAFLMQQAMPGMNGVIDHINEANRNKNYIEDENLPPLLTPPYEDPGALLIAVATYYLALKTLQQQSGKPSKARATPKQIERASNSLLNIVKRLGMWCFKRDVEDVVEHLRNPAAFDKDQDDYDRILAQDKAILEATRGFLETACHEMTGLPVTVIYEKCGVSGLKRRLQDAHTTLTSLKSELTGFDLVTFDVIMPTVQDCYTAFGAVSQLGHIQDRVTDHIANPKQNGYSQIALGLILDPQSLYAQKFEVPVEQERVCQLQIATHTMQAIASYGCLYPACYQRYSKEYSQSYEKEDTSSIERFWQSSDGNVFSVIEQAILEEMPTTDTKAPIVVFNRNRRPMVLPVNATALDFAYALDNELGSNAIEAIVNNRKAPLYRPLQAGDIVEIRTSIQTQADDYWLDEGYVRTPRAKRIIKEAISRKNLEQRGYELIRDRLRYYHFPLPLTEFEEHLRQLLKRYSPGTRQEFLERLEKEDDEQYTPDWAAQEIMKQVAEEKTRNASQGKVDWVPVIDTSVTHHISGTYRQHVCRLCQPSYPRDTAIVGRLRKGGRELIVHRETCTHLIDRNPGQHAKPISMTWQMQSPFRVTFFVKVQDRDGLVLELVRLLHRHNCYLRSIKAEASSPRADIGFVFFTIEVYSDQEVLDIWNKIEKIENFNEVLIDRAVTLDTIADRLEKAHAQGITRTKTIIEFDWEEQVSMLPVRAPILKNPFDISRPAASNMFFGRSEEIKIMQRELCDTAAGRALVLYGPRRSGKSSLCNQFVERYMHTPSWGVLCSLQNVRKQTEATILMHLAEKIGEVFHETFHMAAPSWDDYQDSDAQARFKRFLKRCIEQAPGSRLILVLDEFGGAVEAIKNHTLGYRFFTFWKELLNSIPQLSLLFALPTSSHHTLSAKPVAGSFSFAQAMEMTFLDSESARRLLSDPLHDQQIAIHPNTMARAVTLTGGNPYYLTLIGQQLIFHLNRDAQRQVVGDNDLNHVIEKIIADRTSQNFDYLRSELVFNEEFLLLEKMIDLLAGPALKEVQLRKIAYRAGIPASVARRYLDRLCMGLILNRGDPPSNPFYSFTIELVRRWLTHNRSFFAV